MSPAQFLYLILILFKRIIAVIASFLTSPAHSSHPILFLSCIYCIQSYLLCPVVPPCLIFSFSYSILSYFSCSFIASCLLSPSFHLSISSSLSPSPCLSFVVLCLFSPSHLLHASLSLPFSYCHLSCPPIQLSHPLNFLVQ